MAWQGTWIGELTRKALEPFEADGRAVRQVDRTVTSIVLGLLFLAGSLLSFVALPFLGEPVEAIVRCGPVLVLGIGLGIALVAGSGRLGATFLCWMPIVGAVCIGALIALAGSGGAAIYGLMFFWPVAAAAFLLPTRWAVATLLVSIASLAIAQEAAAAGFAAGRLVAFAGVLSASTLMILGLRRRTEAALDVLEEAANTDPLSGVANRRAFERRFEAVLSGRRSRDESLAVVLIDLDNFKQVNDIWGHEKGDDTVRAVGEILRGETRVNDLAARLGGDEFAVLVEGSESETALGLARRICRMVERRFADEPHGLTVSCGVAWGSTGMDPEEVMRTADGWLYEAKSMGRNRVLGDPEHSLAPAGS